MCMCVRVRWRETRERERDPIVPRIFKGSRESARTRARARVLYRDDRDRGHGARDGCTRGILVYLPQRDEPLFDISFSRAHASPLSFSRSSPFSPFPPSLSPSRPPIRNPSSPPPRRSPVTSDRFHTLRICLSRFSRLPSARASRTQPGGDLAEGDDKNRIGWPRSFLPDVSGVLRAHPLATLFKNAARLRQFLRRQLSGNPLRRSAV